ncbi:MAG TPA: GtrA family protein [Steroidobacteraceae bacterium]|nr:GtrA family protein [Steroidobacteraceae bacterium]
MTPRPAQVARFCAIGLVSFAVSTLVLATLCEVFHVYYLTAFIATFLISNLTGYLLNGRYTFAGHERFNSRTLSCYLVINAILLGINSVLLRTLVESLGVWYIAATVILAAVNVPITFAAHRLVTYRDARSDQAQGASGA